MTNSHNNITCPKCNSAFSIDKSDYALISQQVRTKEFDSELEKNVQSEVSQHKKILEQEFSSKFKLELYEKNKNILQLRSEMVLKDEKYKNKYKELGDIKDKKILSLENTINLNEANTKIKVDEAVKQKDKEIKVYEGEIIKLQNQIKTQVELVTSNLELKNKKTEADLKEQFNLTLNCKNEEIQDLKNQVAYFKNYQMSFSSKDLGENLENYVHADIHENLIILSIFSILF